MGGLLKSGVFFCFFFLMWKLCNGRAVISPLLIHFLSLRTFIFRKSVLLCGHMLNDCSVKHRHKSCIMERRGFIFLFIFFYLWHVREKVDINGFQSLGHMFCGR